MTGIIFLLWQLTAHPPSSKEEDIEAFLREMEDFEFVHHIERDGDVIRIDGHIHEGLYHDLRELTANHEIRRIVVTSPGGEVEAGIDIGFLIWENGIEIEVDRECVSSCANYLFPAAARKIIRHEAAVIWHGNLSQKDFREFWQCGQTVSVISGWPVATQERIEELLNDDYERAIWAGIIDHERDFFARIGVDEFVARIGQEPNFYGDFTMTVADMSRFGITNVEAPEDYGKAQFCQRFMDSRNGRVLHCLEVTDEALAFEEARREYGESCTEEGRLVIDFPQNSAPASDP